MKIMNPDKQLASIREMVSRGIVVDDNVSFLLEYIDYLIQGQEDVKTRMCELENQLPPTGQEQVIRIQEQESLLPKDRDWPDRKPGHEC